MVSTKLLWAAVLFVTTLAAQDPNANNKSNAIPSAEQRKVNTNRGKVDSGGAKTAASGENNRGSSGDQAKADDKSQGKDGTQSNPAQGSQADSTKGQDADGTTLSSNAIQSGSFFDGQQAIGATDTQAASRTSKNNFINECQGQPLTNGLQNVGGSCNGIRK